MNESAIGWIANLLIAINLIISEWKSFSYEIHKTFIRTQEKIGVKKKRYSTHSEKERKNIYSNNFMAFWKGEKNWEWKRTTVFPLCTLRDVVNLPFFLRAQPITSLTLMMMPKLKIAIWTEMYFENCDVCVQFAWVGECEMWVECVWDCSKCQGFQIIFGILNSNKWIPKTMFEMLHSANH